MTAGGPGDLQPMSRNRWLTIRWSGGHPQVIVQWSPAYPPNMGRRYKKSVTLLAPVIPAVVTMMRRLELEAHLAHFNILMGVAAMEYEEEEERQRRRRAAHRRWWVRPWLARRPIYGHYEQLMNELLRENHTDFKMFLRLEHEMFFELVDRE